MSQSSGFGSWFSAGVIQNVLAAPVCWALGKLAEKACEWFGVTGDQDTLFLLGIGTAVALYLVWLGLHFAVIRPMLRFGRLWRVPRCRGTRASILVSRLAGDDGSLTEKLRQSLREHLPDAAVQVMLAEVPLLDLKSAGDVDAAAVRAMARGRRLLKAKGYDLILWGAVTAAGAARVIDLRFVTADPDGGAEVRSYALDDRLRLPAEFGPDFQRALAASAAAALAPVLNAGRFVADLARPMVARLAPLLDHADRLAPAARPLLWHAYGLLQVTIGEQSGQESALRAALDALTAARDGTPRDSDPLAWAGTQNNLGNALQALGQRESGTARLEEAVSAYRLALEERRRERVPLDWATTQDNLGNALSALGERESGPARLEEAVSAYRLALEERRRERVPLDWAATQNNLGTALKALGQRESGTARLEEALSAYRLALEERRRDRVPLDWAMTQNNLGNALLALGRREGGTARLEEAVSAYRLALEERRRERVPLDWATTQNNLGNALRMLGERQGGTARLEKAVSAYRLALEEFRKAGASHYVGIAEGNLAKAEALIVQRKAAGG